MEDPAGSILIMSVDVRGKAKKYLIVVRWVPTQRYTSRHWDTYTVTCVAGMTAYVVSQRTKQSKRTAHPGLTWADTHHKLYGHDSQYTVSTEQCAVCDAPPGSWLVHVGSNLGIIPTIVNSTLGILQNTCARCFKYQEVSTPELK